MKFKLTAVLVVLAIGMLSAQQKKWSLEECVEYAVENNLSIAQFELDLENAKIDESDAFGNLLPDLNANANASERSGLVTNPQTNIIEPGQIFSTSGGISSNMTLFDGLRNIHRLNRAKLNALANQYRLDDLKDDIRLNVANAYLSVLSNKEALNVAKAQYAVTEQDLKRTEELVESGALPRGDLLEIEATAANQEQQIINNENLVLISRISLAQLLQITDYENFDIVDEDFEVPPSDVVNNSAKTIFAKALDFRNDIKLSKTNIELAEKDLVISKGARYPTLGAFFNYNTFYTNQFQTFENPATGEIVSFRNDFVDQLWINDGIQYGFQLNVPVFNGFSVRNDIKRSKINVERAKLQLEQDKLDLETNINQAYVDVENSAKAYEAALKTYEARKLAYDYSKERFDVGLMDAFTFSQAQARVDNAAAEVVRTKYDYIFRIKVLEFYFGLPLVLE
ncbi:TolC family protein [Flavobacteriaceae bacterium TP-CH-4]|uniref:TolC family protein n=1 Tax=Pelagihabitans pacificus TaxID=2696054 RepID=A0A967AQJ2_9FLAO|nr:TolC family protein [Pelagihabitans pacificus]NHF58344.1 TolC family protein [Pelagihabitans pacificus]